jgi:hypothetical protein
MNKAMESRQRGRTRRLKAAAAIAVTALVPTMLSVSNTPAQGTVVTMGAGHNITVFHNIDFVAVFGYDEGEVLTVEVVRPGVGVVGTAVAEVQNLARAGDPPEFGLEVNHGPETVPPADGDCWEGNVPNIRPGDHITVTSTTSSDEVVVDRIRFTPRGPSELRNGDIVVPFNAFRASGTAIPASFIDSPEFRAVSNGQVRFEGNIVVERRPGAQAGQLRMRYRSPFRPARNRPNWNQRQLRRALLGDGHAVGFGHVDPLPDESMLVDGLLDTPGPALGC